MPSQPKLVLIYRSRRDGKLSWPWTHVFYPVAIETAGTWHHQAIELVEKIEKRTIIIIGDPKEMAYLFHQLSTALQRGNAGFFSKYLRCQLVRCNLLCPLLLNIRVLAWLFAGLALKKEKILLKSEVSNLSSGHLLQSQLSECAETHQSLAAICLIQ